MSKYLVNTSQGALGQTLNQLYRGKAYQVRLHPRIVHSCGCKNLLNPCFGLLSRHSGSCGELNPRLGFGPFSCNTTYLCAASRCVCSRKLQARYKKQNLSFSPTVPSTPSTMMPLQCWTTSEDMDTPKVRRDSSIFLIFTNNSKAALNIAAEHKSHQDRRGQCC